MLILTRRVREALIIDGQTTVMVLGVRGNHVTLGIEAPRQVAVNRVEVLERIAASCRPDRDEDRPTCPQPPRPPQPTVRFRTRKTVPPIGT